MPQRAQRVFLNVSEIAIAKTGGYVISKIILASLSALFHGIFFLAIGVPNWLPFALVVAPG
jgi:predicted PurR-regulated permease PerM